MELLGPIHVWEGDFVCSCTRPPSDTDALDTLLVSSRSPPSPHHLAINPPPIPAPALPPAHQATPHTNANLPRCVGLTYIILRKGGFIYGTSGRLLD